MQAPLLARTSGPVAAHRLDATPRTPSTHPFPGAAVSWGPPRLLHSPRRAPPASGAPTPAPTPGFSEAPAGSRRGKEDLERGVPVPVPPASRSPRLAPAAAAAPAPCPSPHPRQPPRPALRRLRDPFPVAGGNDHREGRRRKGTFTLTSALLSLRSALETRRVRPRRPRGHGGRGEGCVGQRGFGPRRAAILREATVRGGAARPAEGGATGAGS